MFHNHNRLNVLHTFSIQIFLNDFTDIKTLILCIFILLPACINEVENSWWRPYLMIRKFCLKMPRKSKESAPMMRPIEILNAAVKIDAKFVPAYNQMGLIFFESDRKDESVVVFKKARGH